ncbi:hypothetical protein M2D63_020230 [Pseudomonas sp. BJa5]|uniref:hypothetical protein n=1 Tax=Pseudomonas sp. BJa5 TaxID=2936270 RepID=UPI0025595B35|nr:hypothetical protein [Pseudomonas sp. BGr12]MDL2423443.1 hypothetical protein [Pseudomonas sp. BGr12]
MNGFWSSWWAFAFMLAPFVIAMSGVAMNTYMACTRDFDRIIASLPNTSRLTQRIPFWGATDFKTRWYLLAGIAGVMIYPKLCVRLGVVDAEDLRNFPPRLRRRLLMTAWLVNIGCIWLAIGVALIKLSPTR